MIREGFLFPVKFVDLVLVTGSTPKGVHEN